MPPRHLKTGRLAVAAYLCGVEGELVAAPALAAEAAERRAAAARFLSR